VALIYRNNTIIECIKKRHQDVAPLQPPTLALFPAWGSSAGAGRIPLPLAAKVLRNNEWRSVD